MRGRGGQAYRVRARVCGVRVVSRGLRGQGGGGGQPSGCMVRCKVAGAVVKDGCVAVRVGSAWQAFESCLSCLQAPSRSLLCSLQTSARAIGSHACRVFTMPISLFHSLALSPWARAGLPTGPRVDEIVAGREVGAPRWSVHTCMVVLHVTHFTAPNPCPCTHGRR
jgi:hypothetical protein